MFGWILAIIMIVAAVFLFFGKGTWIVAGLNVLTEEEKKKINIDLPYTAIYIGITVVYVLYSTLRK